MHTCTRTEMCVTVRHGPQRDAGISSDGWWWVCAYLHSFLLSLEWASSKLWHDGPNRGMAGTGSQVHGVDPARDVAASRVVQ